MAQVLDHVHIAIMGGVNTAANTSIIYYRAGTVPGTNHRKPPPVPVLL